MTIKSDAGGQSDGKTTDGTQQQQQQQQEPPKQEPPKQEPPKQEPPKGQQQQQEPPKPQAPEKYALTLPDNARLDADDLKNFEKIARENNWTNEQAQEYLTGEHTALETRAQRFFDEAKADKDYGGDKLAESQRRANLILDKVRPKGTPRGDAFRALLKKTGFENNVQVLGFLADLGKMTDEDGGLTVPATSGGEKPDLADRLYGHPSSKKLAQETSGKR